MKIFIIFLLTIISFVLFQNFTRPTSIISPGASIRGGPVNVFSYPQQSCMPELENGEWGDRADMAARAYIDHEGKVQFFSGYFDMFRMTGDSLSSLSRVCGKSGDAAVHISPNDPNYDTHRSREWLQAFYTKDGRNVTAIASVDWNGFWYTNNPICKNLESQPAGNIRCWWNKLTAYHSNNGGMSFQPSTGTYRNTALAIPPGHPSVDPDNRDRYGFFHVTNILKDPKSGHYFFFTLATGSKKKNTNGQRDGLCLMRAWSSADLSNPNSWHSWSGADNIQYPRSQQACKTIRMPTGLGGARFLGYSTFYKKYILFGGGSNGNGLYFALSDRLDQWPNQSYRIPFYDGIPLYYISLLDPQYSKIVEELGESSAVKQERRNFDVVGQNPWVYFVEKTPGSNHPILKRVQISFKK